MPIGLALRFEACGDYPHSGGFTGAVWPHETRYQAVIGPEGCVCEDLLLPVGLVEALNFNRGTGLLLFPVDKP
jgi:hypothetical protein